MQLGSAVAGRLLPCADDHASSHTFVARTDVRVRVYPQRLRHNWGVTARRPTSSSSRTSATRSKSSHARRDMRDATRDITRALTEGLARRTPAENRLIKSRPLRVLAWAAAGVVVLAVAAAFFVFPMRDYFKQHEALAQRSAEFEALADANEQLQDEIDALQTPAGVVAAARSELGYVYPGERRVNLLQMPNLPTTLPVSWPYSMVSNIMSVRIVETARQGGPLGGLQP